MPGPHDRVETTLTVHRAIEDAAGSLVPTPKQHTAYSIDTLVLSQLLALLLFIIIITLESQSLQAHTN
jgi:hypothetical protein